MTVPELLMIVYIAGWVLRILCVLGIFIGVGALVKIARNPPKN